MTNEIKSIFENQDKKISERNIFIFQDFNTDMANSIVQQLIYFENESNEPIKIYINSMGGSVFALFSILDTIKGIKSPVYTIAVGEASSAGAVLLSAGDKRFVGENARIMIHEVFSGVIGKTSDIKDSVAELEKIENRLLEVLSKNTGKPVEQIKSDIEKFDKFMSAEEAIEYGLADNIFNEKTKEKFKLNEKMRGLPYAFKFSEFNFGDGTQNLSEAMLFKVGDYKGGLENFSLTKEDLQELKTNFENNVRGIDISIENTHDNDNGEKPAWGWIKNLYPKKNGEELWAKIKFTDKAREKLAGEQYKYISPEFYHKDGYVNEKGERFNNVLIGAALTNRPFQKGDPIKLSEATFQIQEIESMDKDTLIKKLSEEHNINVTTLLDNEKKLENALAKNKELEEKAKKVSDFENENTDLTKTVSELSSKVENMKKENVFENLKKEGKVNEAIKDVCFSQFKSAEDMQNFYAKAPKILHTNAIGDNGSDEEALSEAEQEVLNSDNTLKKEDILKARKI
jgi:ATP-dependent Clp protease protease subunit